MAVFRNWDWNKFKNTLLALPFVLIAVIFLIAVRVEYNSLPSALTEEQALLSGDFPGILTWNLISNISQKQRPIGSQQNYDVYLLLRDQLLEIQKLAAAKGLNVSIPDFVLNSAPPEQLKTVNDLIDQTQLVAILEGVEKDAMLISSHYDSVPISFGASDDGVGVGVSLMTFKTIVERIKKPPYFSLILFINNGEEIGLRGAKWLNQTHPDIISRVKFFINLEAGGTGGPSILFQSTNRMAVSQYAKYATYKHTNGIGGDLMRALGSYTDYDVYSTFASGVDIALYNNRINYHSDRDNIDNLPPGSVQHMGTNTLAYVQAGIITTPWNKLNTRPTSIFSITGPDADQDYVYFDGAQVTFAMYDFSVQRISVSIILVLLIVFTVSYLLRVRYIQKREIDFKALSIGALLFLPYFIALLIIATCLSLLFIYVSIKFLEINPSGGPFSLFFCVGTAVCYGSLYFIFFSSASPLKSGTGIPAFPAFLLLIEILVSLTVTPRISYVFFLQVVGTFFALLLYVSAVVIIDRVNIGESFKNWGRYISLLLAFILNNSFSLFYTLEFLSSFSHLTDKLPAHAALALLAIFPWLNISFGILMLDSRWPSDPLITPTLPILNNEDTNAKAPAVEYLLPLEDKVQ